MEANVVSFELTMIRRDWKYGECIFIIMQKEILSKNIRSIGRMTGKLGKKTPTKQKSSQIEEKKTALKKAQFSLLKNRNFG